MSQFSIQKAKRLTFHWPFLKAIAKQNFYHRLLFVNACSKILHLAAGRSNKVATCLGLQDFSELKKDYGADQAAVIINIAGNIISRQVVGETTKHLSEWFGKIMQVKESVSINRMDTSISKSGQLDYAVLASKIAGLSSGELVGMVADDPDQPIRLKTFHAKIMTNNSRLHNKLLESNNIPTVNNTFENKLLPNYFAIKKEIESMIDTEIEILMNMVE
jgi:hypothetical protein